MACLFCKDETTTKEEVKEVQKEPEEKYPYEGYNCFHCQTPILEGEEVVKKDIVRNATGGISSISHAKCVGDQ